MYINIDLNNEDGHKVYSFECGEQTFDEEDIARTKCQFMYSRADIPYNVDVSTSDDIKGELCDDIEEVHKYIVENYLSKALKALKTRETHKTTSYNIDFVPITYKLYLDPAKYSVRVGRLRFFNRPYVSIELNNSDSKYDTNELLKTLKDEGFNAEIFMNSHLCLASKDSIELVDNCVIFKATVLKEIER